MSIIGQSYYNHPYMNQWNKLYPGVPFPTPQNNPTMFSRNAKTITHKEYIDPLFPNCHARNCPRGLIDYRCQYQHSCWLNLGQLVVYLIMTLLILGIVIGLISKLLNLLYGFFSSMMFMTKMIAFIGSCLECISFGMMEKDVVIEVEVQNSKKLTKQQQQITNKLKQIDIQVNFEVLDKFQTQKLAHILQDYQITSDIKSQIKEDDD